MKKKAGVSPRARIRIDRGFDSYVRVRGNPFGDGAFDRDVEDFLRAVHIGGRSVQFVTSNPRRMFDLQGKYPEHWYAHVGVHVDGPSDFWKLDYLSKLNCGGIVANIRFGQMYWLPEFLPAKAREVEVRIEVPERHLAFGLSPWVEAALQHVKENGAALVMTKGLREVYEKVMQARRPKPRPKLTLLSFPNGPDARA